MAAAAERVGGAVRSSNVIPSNPCDCAPFCTLEEGVELIMPKRAVVAPKHLARHVVEELRSDRPGRDGHARVATRAGQFTLAKHIV